MLLPCLSSCGNDAGVESPAPMVEEIIELDGSDRSHAGTWSLDTPRVANMDNVPFDSINDDGVYRIATRSEVRDPRAIAATNRRRVFPDFTTGEIQLRVQQRKDGRRRYGQGSYSIIIPDLAQQISLRNLDAGVFEQLPRARSLTGM